MGIGLTKEERKMAIIERDETIKTVLRMFCEGKNVEDERHQCREFNSKYFFIESHGTKNVPSTLIRICDNKDSIYPHKKVVVNSEGILAIQHLLNGVPHRIGAPTAFRYSGSWEVFYYIMGAQLTRNQYKRIIESPELLDKQLKDKTYVEILRTIGAVGPKACL